MQRGAKKKPRLDSIIKPIVQIEITTVLGDGPPYYKTAVWEGEILGEEIIQKNILDIYHTDTLSLAIELMKNSKLPCISDHFKRQKLHKR